MKRWILYLTLAQLFGLFVQPAFAKVSIKHGTNIPGTLERYTEQLYHQLSFPSENKVSFSAFSTAYKGYLNLRNAGNLNSDKQILTIIDFTLSSTKHRLWVIDLSQKRVLLNEYVAHGQGSGDEFATTFSNKDNSHQSSIGFYVTGETYVGQHGNSLRLYGMDNGYNSAAFDRSVVMHGANYVSNDFIVSQNRLGRSWGCPAVSNQIVDKVVNYIKDGTCLFIYYPQKAYLASSSWLRKNPDYLPEDYLIQDLKAPIRYVYDKSAANLNPHSPNYICPEMEINKAHLTAMNLSFVKRILP
ncbi:MAG: murein L,D-transpeptidase catalytic domain family protein [Bacteroidetes bacterium]|nr:murein L,D-transpeptidase catalytic domain family protein [Bacteroidota bacterium]MBS1739199.1 murein L,D-transpeptidase catalytic domain family protein [Bacteroidota bacterium]MBS1775648.1 murein L,D-transpeptidase catalytic domain family protein [Bacteroidota bacterium]